MVNVNIKSTPILLALNFKPIVMFVLDITFISTIRKVSVMDT